MNIYYTIFVASVWFLSTYFAVVLLLTLFSKRKGLYDTPDMRNREEMPKVSVIVPVYNESESIAQSIESLKKLDYPKDKLQIIIVNDGSTDDTSEIVRQNSDEDFILFIDNEKNKGKAACLNQGIGVSNGEFVACMDADSEASPDILNKTIPCFDEDVVGAVTVSVQVKNPRNFLEKMVELEYIVGLSLALKALSFFNALHVTPGPFSIYSKKALDDIGYFDVNNITEDLEIAYRLQKHGYKIRNTIATHVKTVVPRDFKSLYVQRKRWYSGSLMTLWQHKGLVFNKKFGAFAFLMPYTFILVLMGLGLFAATIFLAVSNFTKNFYFYSFTNFNFLSYLRFENIDLLSISSLTVLALVSISLTFVLAFFCLRLANKRIIKRVPGIFGFLLLFFIYQLFWATSFCSVLFGKKVKWR